MALGISLSVWTKLKKERVTIRGSNLFSLDDYIKPDLFLQLQVLKEQMGIKSFVTCQLSPFDVCIILAIPYLVGEHENIIPENLSGINLDKGWNGPAVAVAGQNERLLDQLGSGIHVVEDMTYGELGVLDGHHRLAKSKIDGLSYVVTQLFPLIHPSIVIGTWLENFEPLDAEEVKRILKTRGEIVRPKATKFQVVDKNGTMRRIAEVQPNVRTGKDTLK